MTRFEGKVIAIVGGATGTFPDRSWDNARQGGQLCRDHRCHDGRWAPHGGMFLDCLPSRFVAAVTFSLPAMACAILLGFDGSPLLAIAVAVFIGLSYCAEGDMIAYLTARYFGRRHFPWAYAIVLAAFSLSYGLSAVLAGAAYDTLGSYDTLFILLIGGLAFGIVSVICLGRPCFHVLPKDNAGTLRGKSDDATASA